MSGRSNRFYVRRDKKSRCLNCAKPIQEGEDGEMVHEGSGRFSCHPEAPTGTPKAAQVATRND